MSAAPADRHLVGAAHAGPITLIGREHHPPYKRPPLSKGRLEGVIPVEKT